MTDEPAHVPVLTRLRRMAMRAVLLIVVPFLAIITASHYYFAGGRYVVSENAYVKANIIAISADTSGRVVDVAVTDNSLVSAGSVLFKLDPAPLELQVAEARAEMAVAKAEIESMRVDYREAGVAIEAARERVRFLAGQYERQSALKARGLGVTESHDEAYHNLQAAEQSVAVLTQRARRVLANLGGSARQPSEAHPAYLQAEARYKQTRTLLDKTTVLAPASGIVSNVRLQPGEFVQAGNAVFTLIDTDDVWVEANLKETRLTNLRPGQSATIEVDAYPDIEWPAAVSTIAPATGAEFSLLPAQNATGNWVKVVQRVPVKLAVEKPADAPPLRAGMTAKVTIDSEQKRALPEFLERLAYSPLVPSFARALLHKGLAISAPADETFATATPQQRVAAVTPLGTLPLSTKQPERSSLFDLADSLALQKETNPVQTDSTPATHHTGNETEHNNYWLLNQRTDSYTIQIGSSSNLAFLENFARHLPEDRPIITYHYKTNAQNLAEYGLASGLYASRADAQTAMQALPETSKRYGPWVRRIGTIQSEITALDKTTR